MNFIERYIPYIYNLYSIFIGSSTLYKVVISANDIKYYILV